MRTVLQSSLVAVLILALLITAISCTSAKPSISYSPYSLSFTAVQGGNNPAIQAIGIWNSGGGTLDWSVSDDATWLNLSPTNGSSTGGTSNVIVSVDISGLSAGNYNAMITISSPDATSSPQTIIVTLTIAPPALTPSVSSEIISVDASYSGKQVELSVGQSLVVTLESNATTGYSWALVQNSDDSVLSETENEYVAPQTTLIGAGGQEEWTFKALKKGTSTISMGYSRPWENTPPVETFDLTVVVK
jgi:predicted secreted protein